MTANVWLDKEEQWLKLAAAIVKAGEYGFDTETYNQPDKTSPQHRTKIHCWSVAVLYGSPTARGYRQSVGRVLPVDALACEPLVDALLNTVGWAHNAPHDEHSARNHGIALRLNDSLQWLRVAVPDKPEGYGLKQAERWALSLPPRPNFSDMINYTGTRTVTKTKKDKACVCGKRPCRARASSDFLGDDGLWHLHERVETVTVVEEQREYAAKYEVTDFMPGHPRWSDWLDYSLADAVRGIMLVDWLKGLKRRDIYNPWL